MTRRHFVVCHSFDAGGKAVAVMIDPDDTGDDARDIGRRLRLTRRALGYEDRQQKLFAEEAGLSQSHYNKFDTGERVLTLQAALKLCHRYGLTLDWIYRGDPSGLPYALHNNLRDLRRAEREKSKQ